MCETEVGIPSGWAGSFLMQRLLSIKKTKTKTHQRNGKNLTMQKLMSRINAKKEYKLILLYSMAMIVISAIIIASAVVLNANALLVKNENVEAAKNLNPKDLKIVTLAGQEIDNNSDNQSVFASMASSKLKIVTVNVEADGRTSSVRLVNGTVADALSAVAVKLEDEDVVSPSLNVYPEDGETIEVKRAFDVTVKADNKKYDVKMAEGTVADALEKAEVTVDEDDIVSKSLDSQIKADTVVKVSRVSYKTKKIVKSIPYKTITKKTKKMYKGRKKTIRKGVKGKKLCTYKVKYVDGKVAKTTLVKSKVTKKSVSKKVKVGTKKRRKKRTISWLKTPSNIILKNGRPTKYKKIMRGTATAYGPQDGTMTSTGRRAKPGYVAVNPKIIPYGTKMYIVSADGKYNYGYAIAADTGGACRQGRILVDLFFPSASQCRQFGRRGVKIYILK